MGHILLHFSSRFSIRDFQKIIEEGHLFISAPPLYKISYKDEIYYANSDEEKETILEKLSSSIDKIQISRFKGLGEMNPSQLKETTMDIKTRRLIQISLNLEPPKRDK